VLARVKSDGTFDATGGRVEIRYKPNDGRAYQAGVRNLELQPGEIFADDHCADAEKAPSKAEASAQRKAVAAAEALRPGAVPADASTVYADGACSGNPGPAGLGIVIVSPDGKTEDGFEYLGDGKTNNIAELTAVLRAAERLPASAPAVIHTDSQYSIGVLQKGWKAKANQELILEVKAALKKGPKWTLRYVPGHSGVPLNERADELAREAVTSRSTRLPAKPVS
jgi:ribonuclease HI